MSESIAYHEAGHAVVAYLWGANLDKVTVEPDGHDGLGRVEILMADWYEPEERMTFWAAGATAEFLRLRQLGCEEHRAAATCGDRAIGSYDLSMALAEAQSVTPTEHEQQRLLQRTCARATDVLSRPENWAAVQALAKRLVAEQSISGTDAVETIRAARGLDPLATAAVE